MENKDLEYMRAYHNAFGEYPSDYKRVLRKAFKLTLDDISEVVGFTKQMISLYENNKVGSSTLDKLYNEYELKKLAQDKYKFLFDEED